LERRLRRRVLFFRQGGGANQKQFWLIVFALIQKEFLLCYDIDVASQMRRSILMAVLSIRDLLGLAT